MYNTNTILRLVFYALGSRRKFYSILPRGSILFVYAMYTDYIFKLL